MPRRSADPAALEARLGYAFTNRALLTEALTHVSSAGQGADYQRLEFLGDRVLGLAAAELLMRTFPAASEGDLSRRLSELVRRETCAAVAQAWDIGPHLRLGGGARAAMRRNVSILSDSCEAVIGAVFLDGGYEAASAVVMRGFAAKVGELSELPFNPKTALQEWAAAGGRPPPVYAILSRSGPDHRPRFQVAARVEGLDEAVGAGPSRRAAEQAAAEAMLVREGVRASPAADAPPVEAEEEVA